VFAPGADLAGGMAHLFGPTGGYLLAYPVAAAAVSLLWRSSRRGFAMAMASAAAGDMLILLCGAAWLAALTHITVWTALTLAVVPFLPGEALKVVLAAAIPTGYQRLRRGRT